MVTDADVTRSKASFGNMGDGYCLEKVGFYNIERRIGKGNFAEVKLARHRLTRTEVSYPSNNFLL